MSVLMIVALLGLTGFAVREATKAQEPTAPQSQTATTETGPHDAAGHAGPSNSLPNPDPQLYSAALASAELPPGGDFTVEGAKKWAVVPGTGAPTGGSGVVKYTVEVEEGVQVVGGAAGFASDVDTILRDPRGWIGSGKHNFQRVDSGKPDLRISLTSQMTTRQVCGFQIKYEGSCFSSKDNRVTINVARWVRGAVSYQGALVEYKQYVVNHEVGHGIGYEHRPCQEAGALAPVMMQQSWGVSNDYLAALGTDRVTADGKVCRPNAWPYPTGAR
ncbi:DUF3152 domain-containing protein [Lentzea sp. NPDC005914]|uniref:DUF3152 domain-containing protein n=1 Tax=Lentzea sp. NPDC005914 TaxID=3154572 RepID=UPI0033FDA0E0